MWWILATLLVGIAIGLKDLVPHKWLPFVDKLMMVGVFGILFTMGAQVGADDKLLSNLGSIGVSALILAVAAIFGSIACVMLLSRWVPMPEEEVEKK